MTFKDIRIKNGKTQSAIAKEMGLMRSTINQYEKGVRAPNAERMLKLSQILNVPVEDIVKCFVKQKEKSNDENL